MTNFFLSVYDYFSQRRSLLFKLLFFLVIIFLYSSYHIRFKEDISRFLPEDKENKRISDVYQYVASPNTITVYCSRKGEPEHDFSEDADADAVTDADAVAVQIEALDALAGRLQERMDTFYLKSIFYRVNPEEIQAISSFIIENMAYFLDEDDYGRMDTLLTREAIARRMEMNRTVLASPAGVFVRDNILSDPLRMTSSLMLKLQDFRTGDQYRLYQDHLLSADGEALMFVNCTLPASETAMNEVFLDSLQSFIAETEKDFEGVTFDYVGAAEIGLTNARQIRKDTIFSMSLAVTVIFALLIYSFRSGRKILLIFAPVFFGGLFAMALLYVIRGEVSVIAVGISSIMFGIAINYPLHFLEHYNHVSDSRAVIKDIIKPLTIGNITTVGAFMSLVFIGSDAMSDLGWFASLLLIGTILFVLFFLPHFLSAGRKNRPVFPGATPLFSSGANVSERRENIVTDAVETKETLSTFRGHSLIGRFASRIFKKKLRAVNAVIGRFIACPFERNHWLVISVILLTVFFSFFSSDSRFETDMQKINYMTASQKKSFDKMMGLLNGNMHVMYYVTEGRDLEEALEANEKSMLALQSLVDEGRIYRTGGIGDFFPSRARRAEKVKWWEDFWSVRRDSVMTYLREESQVLGFREDAFRSFEDMTARRWEAVDVSHFAPLREMLAGNYIIEKEDKAMIVNMLYIDRREAQALEETLNEINLSEASSSTTRCSGAPPSVTPSSVAFDAGSVTRRMIALLSDKFNYVLYVCGIIVFAFLIFSMGRVELSMIAFTPLVLSWIWVLGMMNIFDIRFNIVNVILATFIFGQGDDYTVFMTEGLMYEYTYGRKMLASYKKSIAMSALIMFVGVGMLILAKHPALRSLAGVTIVGMISVVVMAYIFPSWLFRLLTMKKGEKRLMPVTLKNLLCMIYAFLFFFVMSTIITVAGWVMFAFGKTTERKKMRYHKLLCGTARFVIYHIPQVKTTFRNLSGETFVKPGVIISNHQSHIDLMCIMMLTPKLIILTNDWVWNSPFYGRLIKYADFYPVSTGMENALYRLQDAVSRGYSIVVFPEGTRSADCSIRRFHRGAFYLAEQLKTDIIPVMIHGVGHVLPKEEFMLRKGRIHIRVMPRITPDDNRFRKDYSSRSVDVRHYYQAEYGKLCREIETPGYYADLVIKNYIYKGPAIEYEVRKKLRKNNNYAQEIASTPDAGRITIPNAGYGEYALLLALVKRDLQITAVEPDPDRRAIAENCASVPHNLTYVQNV
ncbi:MAG: 1-acyl-sn-glycerol-3-phosphate acyltransferase [Tannerella sp.]|jgi:1-acyl-sn-glycerol-3-phosphate acyltransferase|nr:1-acyl-sn-glycerol-3-phosphate acyltransferase [Tannerella sp.]